MAQQPTVGEKSEHSLRGRVARAAARLLLLGAKRSLTWNAARTRHRRKVEAAVWVAILGVTGLGVWLAQDLSAEFYSEPARIEALRNVVVTVGGALIGGAAIASSFLLFAMQVNVDRLPYGLFRRLNADRRLMSAVVATFLVAGGVAFLSVGASAKNSAAVMATTFLGIVVVLRLFAYGYSRSLDLISPSEQLRMILRDVQRSLRIWDRRARWARLLWKGEVAADVVQDVRRIAFHRLNPQWNTEVMTGVRHSVALARRAAELGDMDAANAAYAALVAVNQLYIASKGRTFFSNNAFIENPMVADAVITGTLEQLRIAYRNALGRTDEQQIGLILSTYRALGVTYLTIDYGDANSPKSHAQLAAAYLHGDVEALLPHKLTDALMNAVRELGQLATALVYKARPEEVVASVEKIGGVAVAGTIRADLRPALLTAMEQLALISVELIRVQNHNIGYAVRRVRETVNNVAKIFLEVPDTPLTSAHSTYLGPYFSSTSMASLQSRLTELANALSKAPADDLNARRVIRNFADWADQLYHSNKELLLLAVEKRSHFTFDMIHWISGVTEILLAISNAKACPAGLQDDLRKHAHWLAMTLSWLPKESESVSFLETFDLTEVYFEIAMEAHHRGADELARDMQRVLLQWGVEAGPLETGWSIMEHAIYGLAVLALRRDETELVKAQLSGAIAKDPWNQPVRDNAARQIRTKAETLDEGHFELRAVERAMQKQDRASLRQLLREFADILSPSTKDEPISYRWQL